MILNECLPLACIQLAPGLPPSLSPHGDTVSNGGWGTGIAQKYYVFDIDFGKILAAFQG